MTTKVKKQECPFCNNTGIASYLDMEKIPNGTIITNANYNQYAQIGVCPEKCQNIN